MGKKLGTGERRTVGERRGSHSEQGANLVEFAILAPLLILLLLGIAEFGWKFGQFNDVRHGAREGARHAAVNAGVLNGSADDVATYVCNAMDVTAAVSQIEVTLAQTGSDPGDTGTITITATVDSLSGAPLIASFLPSDLTSTVDFRLEQPTTWNPADTPITKSPGSC